MLVALIARDKPGALPVRMENRPAHVEYLKASSAVQQAGPALAGRADAVLVIPADLPLISTATLILGHQRTEGMRYG